MKAEFKHDVNGIYLEITPFSAQEAILLKTLVEPGLYRKLSETVQANGALKIQAKNFLRNIDFDARIRLLTYGAGFNLIEVEQGRFFAVLHSKQKEVTSGPVRIYRLTGWKGAFVKPGLSPYALEWVDDEGNTGPVEYLGYFTTEKEVLQALSL